MTAYVDISWSKNGGHTKGDPRKVAMGETGDFLYPVIVRRLGSARHWVIEFRCTDDVRCNLVAASIQREQTNG